MAPCTRSAGASNSAAQHATLPLRELNKRSGEFGSWAVVVRQAQVHTYDHKWKSKARTGKIFSCVFVSCQIPTEYCIGQMRWTTKGEKKFLALENKLTDGHAFIMTKVSMNNDANKQYIHAPIQTVVNLSDTVFSPLLNTREAQECYPQPPATIADCINLTNQQWFDVTALVKSVSSFRPVGDNCIVFNAEIIDGSKSGNRVRTMPLTVFTEGAAGETLRLHRSGPS